MSKRDNTARRPRNVPHPDPEGTERVVRSRSEASLANSHYRAALDPEGTERKGHGRGKNIGAGLPRKNRKLNAGDMRGRVQGTNGSWPARGVEPKPPAICALYDDVAESELPEAVFGQYPRALIGKLLPWLGCERNQILHVCSGSLPPGEGVRVDVRPEARPDVRADGRSLPFRDGAFAAVLLDPPYTRQYAKDLYGVEYPLPSHLLREAARVVRPCGRIGFVHYLVPMPPPACQLVKILGLSTGFGYPMRAVTIFEKEQDRLL